MAANQNVSAVKIARNYGVERSLGDVLFNKETKSVFTTLKMGVFSMSISIVKRDDGQYDLFAPYTDRNGQAQNFGLGKTFPVLDKNQKIVEGLSKTSLSLVKEYDAEAKKELNNSKDALFLTIHRLKEPKVLGDSGLQKIGWITGQIGIEIPSDKSEAINNDHEPAPAGQDNYAVDDEEIPF